MSATEILPAGILPGPLLALNASTFAEGVGASAPPARTPPAAAPSTRPVCPRAVRLAGDRMRAQLITFLLREGPRNASTLARNVRRDRSTVSRHLQLMLRAGLLATVPSLTGDGRHETYAIDPRWRVPDEPMAIDVGTALLRFGPRA